MENPEREKLWAMMSEKSTIMMGEYRIDLRAMCPKTRSTSDYKFTQNTLSQNKNSVIIGLSKRRTTFYMFE